MIISDLTYKVVAYSEIPSYNTDECVDWAIEMVGLGYDTENLLILAGLNKPTNYFETVKFLNLAIRECGLVLKSGKEGVISYSFYYIKQIAKSINVKENLSKVYKYYISIDNDKLNGNKPIFDFYLLNWAWSDLDYNNTQQEYWPGATISNIEQTVINFANKWLVENENHYWQQLIAKNNT